MTPAFIDKPRQAQFRYTAYGEVVTYSGEKMVHPDAKEYNKLVSEFNAFKGMIGSCPDPFYKRSNDRADQWYLSRLRECLSWYIREVPDMGLLFDGAVDPFPWIPKQHQKPSIPERPDSGLGNGWEWIGNP